MNNIFEEAKNKDIIENLPKGYDVDYNYMIRLWPKYIKYYIIDKEKIEVDDKVILLFSKNKYRNNVTYVYCENTTSIYEYYLKGGLLHNLDGYAYRHYYKPNKRLQIMYYLDGYYHEEKPDEIFNSVTPIWVEDKRVIRHQRKSKLEKIKLKQNP